MPGKFLVSLVVSCVAATIGLIQAPVAFAVAGNCGVGQNHHEWGHQWTSGNTHGQFGTFATISPQVDNAAQDFSLAHLYEFYGNTDPMQAMLWIETGWYKGFGTTDNHPVNPYFYWAESDSTGYHEHDTSYNPTVGQNTGYGIQFIGHNNTTNTDEWSQYYGSHSSTEYFDSRPHSSPLAGGEIIGSSGTVRMNAQGSAMRIIHGDDTSDPWTTANFPSTSTCESKPDINLSIGTPFLDFAAQGGHS